MVLLRHCIGPYAAYKALYAHFGPQGWWPVTVAGETLPRYTRSRYACDTDKEAFEVCAGAILTQNTSWKNAERAITNLNREKLLSCEKIAGLGVKKLAALIKPSGYYNQKAGRLQAFASYILRNYRGSTRAMFSREQKSLREELLKLKGVGPETADSMLLYAGGLPSFVVDAYTLRLGARLGWFRGKIAYIEARLFFTENLPRSRKVYNEFHALIVALAKVSCRKKPLCGACLLKKDCVHGRENK